MFGFQWLEGRLQRGHLLVGYAIRVGDTVAAHRAGLVAGAKVPAVGVAQRGVGQGLIFIIPHKAAAPAVGMLKHIGVFFHLAARVAHAVHILGGDDRVVLVGLVPDRVDTHQKVGVHLPGHDAQAVGHVLPVGKQFLPLPA